VTASVGIALAGEPRDPDALLRAADHAMYVAKSAGGDRWSVYETQARAPVDYEIGALPRLALTGAEPAGWGVVVRGRDGASLDVDGLGASDAARVLGACVALDVPGRLSVPLPSALIAEAVRAAAAALREASRPPADVVLEISDAVLRDPAPAVIDALQRVRRLGVGLAVRGWGDGGASVATLARLPLSELGLDPVLDGAAARASAALGQALGCRVVLTGVDDEIRLADARDFGCDIVQGAACAAAPVVP
jgi:predicted signal transduction protein with EAL and GGDEF domain